jgi:cytochrome P450
VRITPDELSIIDPEFQTVRYGGIGARRNKSARFSRHTVSPTSVLNTLDHDHHRLRRTILNGFFSKQAIMKFESFIQSKVNKVVGKLKGTSVRGTVFECQDVYGALTTDVISHYAYGECFGFLDHNQDDFKNDYLRDISGLLFVMHFVKHFPALASILMTIPDRVMLHLSKGMASMIEIINSSKSYALKTLATQSDHTNEKDRAQEPQTIFQALCNPDFPAEERSLKRLTDEGIVIMIAGLETTARYLTNITYHLLSNPVVLDKLRAELKTVMVTPDARVSWSTLENLPYMVSIMSTLSYLSLMKQLQSAVICEGLRCEKIFTHRTPRVNLEPVHYKEWTIPANVSFKYLHICDTLTFI